MKFAINLPNFGCFGDARVLVDLACEAEDAGWDGFFIWDHLLWTEPTDQPVAEPWVALTAVAMATSRIKLAPLVTPLPMAPALAGCTPSRNAGPTLQRPANSRRRHRRRLVRGLQSLRRTNRKHGAR